MPRPAAKLIKPDPRIEHYLETGEIDRRWAATNYNSGHHVESWLASSQDVRAEDPADTAKRNSLCGAPEEFDTERICKRCGPIPGKDYEPLCPQCHRRLDMRRIVVRRADPLEFGPVIRWEEREVVLIERKDAEGKIKRNREGEIQYSTKTLAKDVRFGRVSEFQRAVTDEQERIKREQLGVSGNRAPDRVFLLPPC